MKLLKMITTSSLILAAFLVVVSPVQAQSFQERRQEIQQNSEEARLQVEENRQVRQQARDEQLERRCQMATDRIELWTTRYSNNQSRFQRIEQQAIEITNRLIERAQTAGKDTTELEAAVATFQSQVDVASVEYQELINLLNQTKSYACGESEGAYVESLRAARGQLLVVREASLQARLTYQQEVRAAVQALLSN